jgi:hypothetical protein
MSVGTTSGGGLDRNGLLGDAVRAVELGAVGAVASSCKVKPTYKPTNSRGGGKWSEP